MSLKAGFPRLCREQVQPVAGCSPLLPLPHPSWAPCTSETQTPQVRFYLLKYFQKHWIFVFQVTGLYLTERVRIIWIIIAMCKKCSHPQKTSSFLAQWLFSLKIWIHFKSIIFISNLKTQPWITQQKQCIAEGFGHSLPNFVTRSTSSLKTHFHTGCSPDQSCWFIVWTVIAHQLQKHPK